MASADVAFGRADLSNCDREPIRIPGSVQPHGVLLGMRAGSADLVVVLASANVAEHLGIRAEHVAGHPLSDLIGAEAATAVAARLAAGEQEPLRTRVAVASGRTADYAGRPVDIVGHESGGLWLVEIEPATELAGAVGLSYRSTHAAVGRLTSATTVLELARVLADEIRALLGFDRVMIYRFDQEWNGEVIAETKIDSLNSFLGLHYPATDIPAQARELYTSNWTRLIADVGYTPVPLVPDLDPIVGAPIDLSHAGLRSVSPIHIEYLTNMGVTASMSVSLLADGRLWGLVACHHYSGPHRPPVDARSAAEFLGQIASLMLVDRERSDAQVEELALQEKLRAISAALTRDARPPELALPDQADQLLDLVGAHGAAFAGPDGLVTFGRTPDAAVLRRIAAVLYRPDGDVAQTEFLAAVVPGKVDPGLAAGALRVGVGPDRWLMWLRPEVDRVVNWGGDPHNKALAAAEGADVRLSPRKSFEKWREVVQGRSAPWSSAEIGIAEDFRDFLNKLLVRRSREQLFVAESLQRTLILPAAPQVPGLQLAARYVPAAGEQVGGDWWDVLPLPDGKVAIAVGDVAGHGVVATAAMAQVRTALRAYLLDGAEPGDALFRLDRLVHSQLEGVLATAVVGVVDPAARRCWLSTAGHLPPLVARPSGAAFAELRPRPPLGVGLPLLEPGVEIDLADDGLLVLFSDGLVERRAMPVDQCLDELRVLVDRLGVTGLDDLIAALVESDLGDRADDATVLAMRFAD